MENHHTETHQHTLWWITSLAISVTCCAILFVVFAGYVVDIKNDLAMAKLHYEISDQRLNQLNTQIDNLYRRNIVQQIQLVPSAEAAPAKAAGEASPPAGTSPPPAAAVPGVTPGTTVTPGVPAGTSTPATITPPPVAPTAVPEIPAKK